ncbi:hypothetical protein EI555_012308, partial [Monodon monoceros]
YDSLVQAQARELSLQRQQIKDSHGICVVYRRHMNATIKAFEELLQASDMDCRVAEGFQEQLNQCAELLKQLENLFLKGFLERASRALSDCPMLSDCEIPEKSSSSRDQKQDSETEKTSVLANNVS